MKKIYYTILIFIFFQSCAPIKTVVDTSCSGYKKEFIPEMKLGIMSVLGGDNKEQYRRPMGDAIGNITNYGACEDKQTLINSTQQASINTEEVIIMICTILSVIIIFSI